jgi:hypothetical protein
MDAAGSGGVSTYHNREEELGHEGSNYKAVAEEPREPKCPWGRLKFLSRQNLGRDRGHPWLGLGTCACASREAKFTEHLYFILKIGGLRVSGMILFRPKP